MTFQNIAQFRLTGVLTNAAAPQTVSISNLLTRRDGSGNEIAANFSNSTIKLQNSDGTIFEIIEASASSGTLTIHKRGLDYQDTKTEVASNRLEWRPGTLGFVVAGAFDLVDRDGANDITGVFNFNSTTQSQTNIQSVTTTEKNALTSVRDGALVYDKTIGAFQGREGGSRTSFGAGASTPNASETVVGKAKAANSTEIANGTGSSGGVFNFTTPAQLRNYGFDYTGRAFVAQGGDDSTGLTGNPNRPFATINGAIPLSNNIYVFPKSKGGTSQPLGVWEEDVEIKDNTTIFLAPGVVLRGKITLEGGGNQSYYLMGGGRLENDDTVIEVGSSDNPAELYIECQSITQTAGSSAAISILGGTDNFTIKTGDIIHEGDGQAINIVDGGDFNLECRDIIGASNDYLVDIEADGSSREIKITARDIINNGTNANSSAIGFKEGDLYVDARNIEGHEHGFQIITPFSGSSEIRNARLTGSVSGADLATGASGETIFWNCVLLGTNAITAGGATDTRLYNCLSTNTVDANTTNLITGGLVTDAQVT